MRREVVMSGIGGQGIQLAAQVLARGALAAGLHVQLFGSYGGMMRGGNTDATLVISDSTVTAPPTVDKAWSGIVMHHDFSEATFGRLRPDSLVLVDETVFEGELPPHLERVVKVPSTALAIGLGRKQVSSMVLLGAYLALTELCTPEQVRSVVPDALPSYRIRSAEMNCRALDAGFEAGRALSARTPSAMGN